ncbi:MAG: flagellar assembly protein FliW [Desulfovibrio sp.]|jgi:flagellar assembly factor FliW|nr:flagellar assembly protein FliW [Desulfovibrio sp.]
MEKTEIKVIDSRLGRREVLLDKVIIFPRGLIGFERLREFTLLQIRDNAPLLFLQSMEMASLGLLVADPFAFIPNYSLTVEDAEQEILQAQKAEDVAVLVTASIPLGKPQETALNLLGPILINHQTRLGLQSPQSDRGGPAKFFISAAGT